MLGRSIPAVGVKASGAMVHGAGADNRAVGAGAWMNEPPHCCVKRRDKDERVGDLFFCFS